MQQTNFEGLVKTNLADVDGFKIGREVCMRLGFPPLILIHTKGNSHNITVSYAVQKLRSSSKFAAIFVHRSSIA